MEEKKVAEFQVGDVLLRKIGEDIVRYGVVLDRDEHDEECFYTVQMIDIHTTMNKYTINAENMYKYTKIKVIPDFGED